MTLLKFLAAAAGAGGVAAYLGLFAADGFDFAFDALGAHGRLLIGGGESGAGGVGVSEGEGARSGLGLALAVAFGTGRRSDLEDDIGDAARDPAPHLSEEVAAFDGVLTLRMGLIAAEGALHDRGFEVVHFEQVIFPGLVVNA